MTTSHTTAAAEPSARPPAAGVLPLVGDGLVVATSAGDRRYIDMDAAASTRALVAVKDAVDDLLPWYSSVHRGAGQLSKETTRRYEAARAQVLSFVGGTGDDVVVFTRNTTEALNVAAQCLPLPAGMSVATTLVEHHANLLPWRRRGDVVQLEPPTSPGALLESLRLALLDRRRPVRIVTLTGASNVTGEILPVAAAAEVARAHGALFVLDAAQLAPRRSIDKAAWGVDAVAISGHKLYAPFGTGALVVSRHLVEGAEPLLAGGGAVDFVTDDGVVWSRAPYRHEAGTPNVVGAVALGAACSALTGVGMGSVEAHDRALSAQLEAELGQVPGLTRYRLWEGDVDRLAVSTFNLGGYEHALLAAVLASEHGIGVRDGCFCAHPYMTRLLGVTEEGIASARSLLSDGAKLLIPGAVRASLGVGSSAADVAALADALSTIAAHGPVLEYAPDAVACCFEPETSA